MSMRSISEKRKNLFIYLYIYLYIYEIYNQLIGDYFDY